MAANSVDELLRTADFRQELRGLLAVLLRPLLEVHVVEQAHGGPEARLVPVAQVLGVPAHDGLHSQGVLEVEGFGVVLAQQRQGRRSVGTSFHGIVLL